MKYPNGLYVDNNGDVYVADCDNNRVSVFSRPQFLKLSPQSTADESSRCKMTQNSVVVLDRSPNCIHFFSRSGELLRSCVTNGKEGIVYSPWFFCLDTAGNILITDNLRHSIKIFSPSGQLIHTVGR